MSKTRPKLSEHIAADVMYAVDLRCCMCEAIAGLPPRSRNGQIHHLDGDPTNNARENLVWLCLEHHEDVGKTGKTSRRISPEVIRRYRSMLEAGVERDRRHVEQRRSSRVIYQAALDANVVTQLWKLKTSWAWDDWRNLLLEVDSFPPGIGYEAKRAILERLVYATVGTRNKMPGEIATMISDRTVDLLPLELRQRRKGRRPTKDDRDLLQLAAEIGEALAYDGALYLHDVEVVYAGCEILWRVLSYARINSLADVDSDVIASFETALDGATRSGLAEAVQLVQLAKQHGAEKRLRPPTYPKSVTDAVLARMDERVHGARPRVKS